MNLSLRICQLWNSIPSANKLIVFPLQCDPCTESLIYIMEQERHLYRILGSSRYPVVDFAPFKTTNCFLFNRYEQIHRNRKQFRPIDSSLSINALCGTESKAFCRSKYIRFYNIMTIVMHQFCMHVTEYM